MHVKFSHYGSGDAGSGDNGSEDYRRSRDGGSGDDRNRDGGSRDSRSRNNGNWDDGNRDGGRQTTRKKEVSTLRKLKVIFEVILEVACNPLRGSFQGFVIGFTETVYV